MDIIDEYDFASVAATLGSELLSRGTGKITGRKVEEATRVNIKCFHCNDCGNDFE